MTSARYDVVVVGLGPAGIGVGLALMARAPRPRVLFLDAGPSADERTCEHRLGQGCAHDDPCKVLAGVMGSCAASGGKISHLPAGSGLVRLIGDERIAEQDMHTAYDTLAGYLTMEVRNVSPADVVRAERCYREQGLGFKYYRSDLFSEDAMWAASGAMFGELREAFEIRLRARMTEVTRCDDGFLVTAEGGGVQQFVARSLVLATGKLGALETVKFGRELGARVGDGSIDVGVRLEVIGGLVPGIDRFHNDLKLSADDWRTYCVCKDGQVIAYEADGYCSTEGIAGLNRPTGLANLGLLVRRKALSTEAVVAAVADLRQGAPINESLVEFREGRSVLAGLFDDHVHATLVRASKAVLKAVGEGVGAQDVAVFGPEIHPCYGVFGGFSPAAGLHVVGEATGAFRGILQSFCSGLRCGKQCAWA